MKGRVLEAYMEIKQVSPQEKGNEEEKEESVEPQAADSDAKDIDTPMEQQQEVEPAAEGSQPKESDAAKEDGSEQQGQEAGGEETDAEMEGGDQAVSAGEEDNKEDKKEDPSELTVSEQLPVRKRLPGLPPPSSVSDIRRDLIDREAVCITVRGLDFSGTVDLEVSNNRSNGRTVVIRY